METKLASFIKTFSQGILNDTTAMAMNALEAQKRELDAVIQAEHVKATLYEDEASIGAFYKQFAEAAIDTVEIYEHLFDYFVDKIFIGGEQVVIASYYHDSAASTEFEDLEAALHNGNRAGEVPNLRSKARVRHLPLRWQVALHTSIIKNSQTLPKFAKTPPDDGSPKATVP